MTYDIVLAAKAYSDLKNIYEYIAFSLQNPCSAANQIDRLEKGINSLNQMPERHRIYDKEPWKSRNTHIMIVDKYLIFYTVDKTSNVVNIVRILYGGRNLESNILN